MSLLCLGLELEEVPQSLLSSSSVRAVAFGCRPPPSPGLLGLPGRASSAMGVAVPLALAMRFVLHVGWL
eukprot:4008546-Alexandrium_andersonii.AAC.1